MSTDYANDRSLCEWLARPEWQRLLELLRGHERDALAALLAADPNQAAAVARAQTEVRVLRYFISGDAAKELKEGVK